MMTLAPARWAEETFGACDLGDLRRVRRLVTIATSLAEHSGRSLVGSCANGAELEGIYRFIENEDVEGSAIRDGGFEATIGRARACGVVLAVEDSTV